MSKGPKGVAPSKVPKVLMPKFLKVLILFKGSFKESFNLTKV